MTDSTEKPGADGENAVEDQIVEASDAVVDEVTSDVDDAAHAASESEHDIHADAPEHDHDDTHEIVYEEVSEERGTNWAARILFWLLLLIAGAAGALWGGPKLATQLPQWAAPAAKYLTPGGDAALAEAQAVRTDVDSRLGEFDTRLVDLPSADGITEAVAAAEARLGDRIAALEEAAGASEAVEALSTRMGEIEGRLDGLTNDLTGLSDALSTAAVEGGAISAETMAEISANATTMAGLQSGLKTLTDDVGTLSGDVTALSGRMDTIETETLKKAEAAEAAAKDQARLNAIEDELDGIRGAIDAGQGFGEQLAALGELGVAELPAALTDAADGSLATTGQLRSELTPLAHEAIRQTIRADAGDNTAGRIGAFLQSQVATRSLEPGEGDSTDAVLSRIEAALGADDLATVISEAEALPDVAKGLLDPWLGKVGARMAALDAVEAIGSASASGS